MQNLYFDAKLDDARLKISVAITLALYGVAMYNYTDVVSLLTDCVDEGQIKGTCCHDVSTEVQFDFHTHVIIKSTGPFTYGLHKMENTKTKHIINLPTGFHKTIPRYYSSERMDMIVAKPKHGRDVFILPWLGVTISLTTDTETEITKFPLVQGEEIQFILEALSHYLLLDVRAHDLQRVRSLIQKLPLYRSGRRQVPT